MAELAHLSVAAQIGADDPAASGAGVVVRMVEAGTLRLVSGAALAPNTVADGMLWLAPERALQLGGAAPEGFVADVSDGFAVFELAGGAAADLLAMGSTLDPALLAPGRCAQSVFAGVKVVLYGTPEAIRLIVERSLAAYLLAWFKQAAGGL